MVYLIDLDTGSQINRFVTDDPIGDLTKALERKGNTFGEFIMRIERMALHGELDAEKPKELEESGSTKNKKEK